MRAGLGIRFAAGALAMAAILTAAERQAFAVRVRLTHRRGRLREWMVAEFAARLGVHQRRLGHLHSRRRIFVAARAFEYIAAVDLLTAQVAGLAGDAAELIEPVVIRLQLVIGHRPVLDRHVLRNGLLAVTVDDVAAREVIAREIAPVLTSPMVGRAADSVAGQERSHPTHWQR